MLDLNEVLSLVEAPAFTGSTEFNFQSAQAEDYLKGRISQRNQLAGRLERLICEPRVCGQPLVELIIKTFPGATPEELSTVAKALQRISELMPKWQEINTEVNGLVWASENTDRLALAFGNFSSPDTDFFVGTSD